jgi:Secretion system C-terminal sorting domain
MMIRNSIKTVATFVMLVGVNIANAQTLTPVVIASTGGYGSGAWGSLSYTGGEAVIQTGVSSVVTLTQGFHQPLIKPNLGIKTPTTDDPILFFPNPAHDYINITTTLTKGEVRLYNDVGQVLWQSDTIPEQIPIDHFAIGMYQIVVISDNMVISKKLLFF